MEKISFDFRNQTDTHYNIFIYLFNIFLLNNLTLK